MRRLFDEVQVLDIRRRWSEGVTQRELAKEYNTDAVVVRAIVHGLTYKETYVPLSHEANEVRIDRRRRFVGKRVRKGQRLGRLLRA